TPPTPPPPPPPTPPPTAPPTPPPTPPTPPPLGGKSTLPSAPSCASTSSMRSCGREGSKLDDAMKRLTDGQMIDWLQQEIVDTIYLDDGRIIDVRGGSLRDSIREAMSRPKSDE